MTAKHTPGPWSIAEGDGCFIVETDDSTVRFVVIGLNMEGDRSNAQLIAAAPDLLEALKLADAMLSGATMNANVVEQKVRAAIAKAIGGVSI